MAEYRRFKYYFASNARAFNEYTDYAFSQIVRNWGSHELLQRIRSGYGEFIANTLGCLLKNNALLGTVIRQ